MWWVITLLPLFIVFIMHVFLFLVPNVPFPLSAKNIDKVINILIQQLLFYGSVLSCSDLTIKFQIKNKESSQIAAPILVILSATIAFVISYIFQDWIFFAQLSTVFFFAFSIVIVYIAIWLYNQNPEAAYDYEKAIFRGKQDSENNAQKRFKSPKRGSKIKDVKWG